MLTISGSTISDNTATGGENLADMGACANADGGGIFSSEILVLTSTTVSNNSANGGELPFSTTLSGDNVVGGAASGGGIYTSDADINSSAFHGNRAIAGSDAGSFDYGSGFNSASAWGGAIFSSSTIKVTSSTFLSNQVSASDGPWDDNGPGGDAYGGAIAAEGSLTLTGSDISTNTANGGSGSIYASGSGTGSSLAEDSAFGGGIYSTAAMTISDNTISGNTALAGQLAGGYGGDGGYGQGGGVFASGDGTITSCSISGNNSDGGLGDGSGPDIGGPGGPGDGAGVFNDGELSVVNSTIADNEAAGGPGVPDSVESGGNAGGDGGDGNGAGIYSSDVLTLYDCTVSGNSTAGGAGGAGDSNYPAGMAGIGLAAGVTVASGTALFGNSIISGNISHHSPIGDVSGTVSSFSSHNLIGGGSGLTSGVNGNQIGNADPMLGTLANNGSPTLTMLPLVGSPAINAGNNDLIPSGISDDQRGVGYPRIISGTVDIGAVEYQPPASDISNTVLTASSYLVAPGAPVTLIAIVSGTSGDTPTGSVTFSVNGSSIGAASLNGGAAGLTTAALPAGELTITADYSGDSNNLASGSNPITEVVQTMSPFAAGFVRIRLPASVIAGTVYNFRLPLLLTNAGSTSKGTFTIKSFASKVAGLDGSQTALFSVRRKLSLKYGSHARITQTIKSLPASLPSGNYYLIAEVMGRNGLLSEAISPVVAVAAPLIRLSATVNGITPESLIAGKFVAFTITITNSGNVAASGVLHLTIDPSPDGATLPPEAIGAEQVKTSIPAGKSRIYRTKMKVPASIGAGNYFPVAMIVLDGEDLTAAASTRFTIT